MELGGSKGTHQGLRLAYLGEEARLGPGGGLGDRELSVATLGRR